MQSLQIRQLNIKGKLDIDMERVNRIVRISYIVVCNKTNMSDVQRRLINKMHQPVRAIII